MKVLHVEKFVRRSRGGASAYMLDVVERQRLRGHDVAVFGMQHPDNEQTRYAEQFAPRVELDPPPAGVVAKARTAARMIWSAPAAEAITRVLDDFEPDVVHCHNIYHQLSPSVLAPIAERAIPTVMTVHDFKLVCPTYHLRDRHGIHCTACVTGTPLHVLRKRCEDGSVAASGVLAMEAIVHRRRDSYAAVDAFICPSRYLMENLERGGLPADRLRHLPNAIELPGEPTTRTTADELRLVFTGSLIERKGVDLVLEAIRPLHGVSLTICGDGPERDRLVALAASFGDRVRFTGHLDRGEIAEQLSQADALVLASRGMENQPLSVLEALAHGVPAVVADTAPMRELVTHGQNGLLFESGSAAALGTAIEELWREPSRRAALGVAARQVAEERHDINRHLDQLEDLYREVLALERTPRREHR